MKSELLGYKALSLQFSPESTSCHEIFIKEYSMNKDEDKPLGQTLFVINVPPLATEDGLKKAFSPAGKVVKVMIDNRNDENGLQGDGFKKAFIIFSKRESLLNALKLTTLHPLSTLNKPLNVGVRKWMEEYNSELVDITKLQKQVAEYMKSEAEDDSKKEETVDDEGWTLVTRDGRKSGLSRKESVKNKLHNKIIEGSEKKELKNFYRFQIRESKMQNIVKLRENFEEAKKKVKLMKEARKFKPY